MTDLHALQSQLVARIVERPTGSASKFALMDAADAVSRAIDAEARESGAQTARNGGAHRPETQQSRAQSNGAELGEHRP